MPSQNRTEASKFAGIRFDAAAFGHLTNPGQLIGTVAVNPLPVQLPDSWTPLGGADSTVAGTEQATAHPPSGSLGHLASEFRFVNNVSGPLGTANDMVAVGQHLVTGQFQSVLIEAGGVVGQDAGAAGVVHRLLGGKQHLALLRCLRAGTTALVARRKCPLRVNKRLSQPASPVRPTSARPTQRGTSSNPAAIASR